MKQSEKKKIPQTDTKQDNVNISEKLTKAKDYKEKNKLIRLTKKKTYTMNGMNFVLLPIFYF